MTLFILSFDGYLLALHDNMKFQRCQFGLFLCIPMLRLEMLIMGDKVNYLK